nr:MarR family transcriptional regulator [Methylophilales phage MEP433]WOZ55690.1 MarR family transcriptional regulator [Methylophilales phage MEP434]
MKGNNLLSIIEEMRKLDCTIESQAIAVFFTVCLEEQSDGISMQSISDKLSIAQSSVSRNVFKLSTVNRHRVQGLGLVESYEDPSERRRKLVKTTAKGRKLFAKLTTLVKQ